MKKYMLVLLCCLGLGWSGCAKIDKEFEEVVGEYQLVQAEIEKIPIAPYYETWGYANYPISIQDDYRVVFTPKGRLQFYKNGEVFAEETQLNRRMELISEEGLILDTQTIPEYYNITRITFSRNTKSLSISFKENLPQAKWYGLQHVEVVTYPIRYIIRLIFKRL